MRMHRGWIALDIDGTITDASHHVPPQVAEFLHSLYTSGWELMFITGRTFSFAYKALQIFNFPFYLALQNGADILHMPSKTRVARHYLDSAVVQEIEEMHKGIPEDFILYSGYERGDFCYYRPKRFSNAMLAHLRKIMPLSLEPWKEVDHFNFDAGEMFPLIKCLGVQGDMERLTKRLETLPNIAATMIRDPLDGDRVYLILVTHAQATKGNALLYIMNKISAHEDKKGPVIAAGDDLNDISMLNVAHCKIVMENAPIEMRSMAHILAKPGHEQGIIAALKKAIHTCQ